MCFLVQEPEENVNIINNNIQIMHKSTYLKTYLKKKKEIRSKKNGSFSSTQAPHQQFSNLIHYFFIELSREQAEVIYQSNLEQKTHKGGNP